MNAMTTTFWQRFCRNPLAVTGLSFLGLLTLIVCFGGLLYPDGPFQIVGQPLQRPFEETLLGTDSLGRDIAAGLVHGGRTSLLIALTATLAAMIIGTVLGAISGYYGGWVDTLLMRCTEFFQTIPTFLFAIVLVAILSPKLTNIVIAVAVISWPPIVRLVRAEVMSLREREFIQACVCLGLSDSHILVKEILPNVFSAMMVAGSMMVATAILTEAALSFLGLGDPNAMSWGFMIGAGRTYLRDAWWLCAIPGMMILLTVLCINFVGEGLSDAMNPRLQRI